MTRHIHAYFAQIAQRHGATVAVKPADYGVIDPQPWSEDRPDFLERALGK